MKQLQKYYFGHFNGHENELADFYKCSEADAAFAEMRRRSNEAIELCNQDVRNYQRICDNLKQQHAEHIARIEASTIELQRSLEQKLQETKQALIREHAEEIERLKAALKHYAEPKNCEQFWIDEYYRYRKQAGRYEKLRRLNPQQFLELWKTNLMGPRFDDLVDQLPASGEAQK